VCSMAALWCTRSKRAPSNEGHPPNMDTTLIKSAHDSRAPERQCLATPPPPHLTWRMPCLAPCPAPAH
jgi:hypothetical protein